MNKEHLRFVAQYLEVAQIEMRFIDPTKNYASLISPRQLETIKYGYEKIDGKVCNLRQATVLLGRGVDNFSWKDVDYIREIGRIVPFGDYSEEQIINLQWAKIIE